MASEILCSVDTQMLLVTSSCLLYWNYAIKDKRGLILQQPVHFLGDACGEVLTFPVSQVDSNLVEDSRLLCCRLINMLI